MQLRACIIAIGRINGVERLRSPRKLRDVPPMLLEVLERLRSVVERRVGELRQCVHQILRQLGVKTIADAWIANGTQQMQMLLNVGAAEDAPAKLGAILGSLLLPEQGTGLDQDPQCVSANRHAAFDEMQVEAYAERCNEPPGRDLVSRAVRANTASEVEVRIALCNLEPQVSLRLRFISA